MADQLFRDGLVGRPEHDAAAALRRDGEVGCRQIGLAAFQRQDQAFDIATGLEPRPDAQMRREGAGEIRLIAGAGIRIICRGAVEGQHNDLARFANRVEGGLLDRRGRWRTGGQGGGQKGSPQAGG